MKLKIFITALGLLIGFTTLNAQSDLHIPKEIQKAYKNQTRAKDGKPGKNYWQNKVNYNIEVTVSPESRVIDGKEQIVFTNNSPDELGEVVIRLYYDVFKKGNQRGMQVNQNDIGEGTTLKKVAIEGVDYDLSNPGQALRRGTNMSLRLAKPLRPGNQITIDFEWEQKVPLTVRRTGAIDDTSFFIAYWYPQVAVYDDIFGWDRIDYTYDTEFYNNLADFDVHITAPDNFLVWATGTLKNDKDILPEGIHKRYTKAKTAKELVHVVTEEDLVDLKLKSNTWHYKASDVTDFAFAMSDHYAWDALSQNVAGKDVFISTAFPKDQGERYLEETKIQQKAMKHFSEDIPGVPYPYPAFTAFIGLRGGGMEFPMMANNAGPDTNTTIHELFHTYFPMYVRINERRFAWMDEGWADFATALIMHKYFNSEENTKSFYADFKLGMQGTIGSIGDLPAVTSSQYMGTNYGYHSYTLPSFTYALLYQHLGEEKFNACFNAYINRWAKKSPTPYDFFYTFEDVSGEDLSFIWDSWYFKMGYPDVGITSFKNGVLTIHTTGARPVPVSVQVVYEMKNGKQQEPYTTVVGSSVWKDGNTSHSIKIPNASKVKSLVLNSDNPDFNELDNYYPSLADRSKVVAIDDSVLGTYSLRPSLDAIISKVDGVYVFELTGGSGISMYLLPKDSGNFISTDGTTSLTFTSDTPGQKEIEIFFSTYNITFKGPKK